MFFFLVALLILIVSFLLALRSLKEEKEQLAYVSDLRQKQAREEAILELGSYNEEEPDDAWIERALEPESQPPQAQDMGHLTPYKAPETVTDIPHAYLGEPRGDKEEKNFLTELESYLQAKPEPVVTPTPIQPLKTPPAFLSGEFILPRKI